jgi:hypothetical protein
MTRIGSAFVSLLAVLFLAAGCGTKPQKPTDVPVMTPEKPPEIKSKTKDVKPPPDKEP